MDDHTALVLIGEPDETTSTLYQSSLAALFTVLAVPDGETIIDVLHSRPVAAVVIEPMLFPTHSWERLAVVGRACAQAGVPLVICSTQDERSRGRDLGAAAYLVKPTLPATLIETIRRVLNTSAR